MAPPSIWGPPLWDVLHTIGYMTKRCKSSLQTDSQREAIWILRHIEYIIPCKECVQHLIQFRNEYPVPNSYTMIGEWICKLHNSVNVKLGKETVEYSEDIVLDSAESKWLTYSKFMDESILLRLVTGPNVRDFRRHMFLWIRYTA